MDQQMKDVKFIVNYKNKETMKTNKKNGTNHKLIDFSQQLEDNIRNIWLEMKICDQDTFDEWEASIDWEDIL